MEYVLVWAGFILIYLVLFKFVLKEVWEDSKGWFFTLTLLTLLLPTILTLLIHDVGNQVEYINDNKCSYTGESKTTNTFTTTTVNNVIVITPISSTVYLWKCPTGLMWFGISPAKK